MRKDFFHATQVISDFLIFYQASRSFGKVKAERRERVATAARYPLSMGQLDRAALFCPFSILKMYSGNLVVSSHHVSMVRRISTASMF